MSAIQFDQNMLSLDSLIETGFDIVTDDDFTEHLDDEMPSVSSDIRWVKLSEQSKMMIASAFISLDDALLVAFRQQFHKVRPTWVDELLSINKSI